MKALRSTRAVRVAGVCVVQALLVAIAVWPQLSARLTGREVLLAVAPVDPIDPFRGAYVRLAYPGLPQVDGRAVEGTVFVPLEPADGPVWRGDGVRVAPPEQGPYLRCHSDGWQLSCGIESWFLPQDEALRVERELADGALARLRVDRDGHAALVAVEPGA